MEYKLGKENQKQAVIENLKDAGCDENFINQYIQLADEGRESEQMRQLRCHRCTLLDTIHKEQKKLDCLDYLIYTTKNGHPGQSFFIGKASCKDREAK